MWFASVRFGFLDRQVQQNKELHGGIWEITKFALIDKYDRNDEHNAKISMLEIDCDHSLSLTDTLTFVHPSFISASTISLHIVYVCWKCCDAGAHACVCVCVRPHTHLFPFLTHILHRYMYIYTQYTHTHTNHFFSSPLFYALIVGLMETREWHVS